MVKSHCMELREMTKLLKNHVKLLLVSIFVAGALGAATYYFLPTRYYATGSLFVRRSIYPYSEDHFTYEGYYGQQAAMLYANSVIGLIDSDDIVAQTLTSLNMPVDQNSLRTYHRKIRTVKSGPQLIELVVKEEDAQKAGELWQAVVDVTTTAMNNISRVNDPFVGVVKVSDEPVIKEGYKNLPVYSLVGAGVGLCVSLFYLVLLSYFRSGKKR